MTPNNNESDNGKNLAIGRLEGKLESVQGDVTEIKKDIKELIKQVEKDKLEAADRLVNAQASCQKMMHERINDNQKRIDKAETRLDKFKGSLQLIAWGIPVLLSIAVIVVTYIVSKR